LGKGKLNHASSEHMVTRKQQIAVLGIDNAIQRLLSWRSDLRWLPYSPRTDINGTWSGVWVPAEAGNFFFLITASRMALGPTQPPIQWVTGAPSLGSSGRGVKLITHLHLVPSSRMRGAIPPSSQYGFTAWCSVKSKGRTLPFTAQAHASVWTFGAVAPTYSRDTQLGALIYLTQVFGRFLLSFRM
jgi:hypothetical protein